MEINIQFKKGVLELCALVIINCKDQYGYELAQSITEHFQVAEGAIYPLLRRLVQDGYCTTYLQESSEGPPRKYYRLTETGEQFLTELQNTWDQLVASVNEVTTKNNTTQNSNGHE